MPRRFLFFHVLKGFERLVLLQHRAFRLPCHESIVQRSSRLFYGCHLSFGLSVHLSLLRALNVHIKVLLREVGLTHWSRSWLGEQWRLEAFYVVLVNFVKLIFKLKVVSAFVTRERASSLFSGDVAGSVFSAESWENEFACLRFGIIRVLEIILSWWHGQLLFLLGIRWNDYQFLDLFYICLNLFLNAFDLMLIECYTDILQNFVTNELGQIIQKFIIFYELLRCILLFPIF